MNGSALLPPKWAKFKQYFISERGCGFSLDISRMNFDPTFLTQMDARIKLAISKMAELEKGAIANPDENRMVGHYWLRTPELAPSKDLTKAITETLFDLEAFVGAIHQGKIQSERGTRFEYLLSVGIGGSALGPQFVSMALQDSAPKVKAFFIDNTDPDGIIRTVAKIPNLSKTLTVVISKSGGTKETRNGMLEVEALYKAKGLNFAKHAVAVTGEGSELDKHAIAQGWLKRFPMWDWVGGRTSELSAVGLLPAALEGFDIKAMLKGAASMDELTRRPEVRKNPAAMLALMWYHAGEGKGLKSMVVLPYKDRFELLSKYLQQLVMESVGKEKDLDGKVVNQGLAVYGNKGSTDQHAYVQQLRDGINNFFAVFIEVLEDFSSQTKQAPLFVETDVTSGDYLNGFLQGTRTALYQGGRESVLITVRRADAFAIGMLIALFERAVGLYANLINVNAYHQPGVEAGKKAATEVLKLQCGIIQHLKSGKQGGTAEQIAQAIGVSDKVESVFLTLRHLAANGRVKVIQGQSELEDRYSG